MEESELESYKKSGKIASDIREWSKSMVKPGASILEIADAIESRIIEMGAQIAFPTNICLNDTAAHYAPKAGDETIICETDVVTIDLGTHVDGFIADTAYTIDLSGDYDSMLSANKEALDTAISLVEPGVSVSDIGAAVQDTLNKAGYKPIENLTGHEVKAYELHAGISIPNIKVPYDWKLREGMVIAIEPFATDGFGRVIESRNVEIFSLKNMKPTRMREERILLKEVEKRNELPFAARWYAKKLNPMRLNLVLSKLCASDILHPYPTLHEKENGVVSQFEHTVIVTGDGSEVTTL